MGKKKKTDLSPFYGGMDPEIREALLQVQEDRSTGKLKPAPEKATDCHLMEDLCLYVFRLAQLDGSYQMLKTAARLQRWVWFGHDFGDNLVDVVEEVVPQIADKKELKELRLVATRVTPHGIERLRELFPNARVTVYTDEDDKRDWRLSQASYSPQKGKRR
jgi:hypothetical protein